MGRRVGERSRRDGAELRRARLLVLVRGGCGPLDDKRADSAARLEGSGSFEVGIDLRHRVRVDAKGDRELADGGQLVTVAETARGDGDADAPLELRVERRRVAG